MRTSLRSRASSTEKPPESLVLLPEMRSRIVATEYIVPSRITLTLSSTFSPVMRSQLDDPSASNSRIR
ncbi:MAG: hypothetical protein BWX47_01745 [candidate division Hyd24-12 bacterium ADurb.Bin004]|nr:MAG: hypothetical protein BWX47_01745 [candidate division Hyd24-12 bacterium ADurb.Bin004]